MAKYQVTFSCSHTSTVELFGKTSDRERKIAYFETSGLCPECFKAAKAAEATAKLAACDTLPILTGSDKQIAWATKIRANAFDMYQHKGFTFVANQTSAAWWIDNRDNINSAMATACKQAKIDSLVNMTKSEIFKHAHALAKNICAKYTDANYQVTFAQCLKEVYATIKSLKKVA